jgi:regulator of sigma E protease
MYILQNIHWFILLLGALVFFHEFGHFIAAKLSGVKVLKFSFGFGPRLIGIRGAETEYLISALPLGGYVKMLGEIPDSEVAPEDAPRSFAAKPVWVRSIIVLAGPAFNILLAFLVYIGMFTGTQTFGATRLGIVTEGDPAWNAGLRPGDTITAIDGQPVADWEELREQIGKRPEEALRVTYERQGTLHTAEVKPQAHDEANVFQEAETRGRIGVSVRYVRPILGIVDKESPAAKAGLETGDEVVEANGRPIEAWQDLRAAVAATAPGTAVRLTVRRGNDRREAVLTPTTPPAGLEAHAFSAADPQGGYTGLVSRDVLVAKVDAGTPASRAGLEPGDRLLRLRIDKPGGESVERPISVWGADLAAFSGLDARNHFVLTFQRGRDIIEKPLLLEARQEKDELKNVRTEYVFGATNDDESLGTYTFTRRVGPLEATREAASQVGTDVSLIGLGVAKLFSGSIPLNTMGGPIMLFVIAEKSAKRGATAFLRVLAVISVNLGLLNLLPIPVLDGGHLLFFGMEVVRRRPPSLRVREYANIVGLALLALLMILVFRNDILRYVLG